MSIKVMTLVWDKFDASGSELLCMLAMADWCADDGGSLYPSMKAVAEKVRLSEKQARRIVHKLEADGWLAAVGNLYGGAPGVTRQYRMDVQKLRSLPDLNRETAPAGVTPPASVTPPMGVQEGSRRCPEGLPPVSQTPPTHGSLTIKGTIKEPSRNHQHIAAPSADELLSEIDAAISADWLAMRKAKKAPVTKTAMAGIRREAEKAGLTLEQALAICCQRGWAGFEAKWVADKQPMQAKRPSRHSGFESVNYSEGVSHDGSF